MSLTSHQARHPAVYRTFILRDRLSDRMSLRSHSLTTAPMLASVLMARCRTTLPRSVAAGQSLGGICARVRKAGELKHHTPSYSFPLSVDICIAETCNARLRPSLNQRSGNCHASGGFEGGRM